MRLIWGAGVLCAVLAGPGLAKPPLRDVPEIRDGLMAVGIADEIRKKCDDISARMIRAMGYMNALERRARDMGYSEDEIEDYVTSRDEKRAMRARGEAWLAARGAEKNDDDSYCAVGRAEIKAGSAVGRLLRSR